ncbi:MAG: ABC transporter ATP-binding protein [Candidatus Rokuibacteriota bacterium]|nr:MAG: ABC transporter ATP-binding protein [Candidatus Rokubacteria bacterium]
MNTPPPLLTLRGITKSFPGVLANDRVDLDVHRGEVHAIVGENGAGKSTLMKILYGFHRPDAGEIELDGRPIRLDTPHAARRCGIGMVFQELVQVPALTVVENIALFLPDLPVVVDGAAIATRIRETAERYGLAVPPAAPLWQLSVGEQQRVEIVKLLLADARILILDEPTRSLAPHEVDGLFRIFANLRRDGYAIVFIAHKLREVLACADRVTVLRRGVVAGSLRRDEATAAMLVSLMFGALVAEPVPRATTTARPGTAPILQLERVSVPPLGHGPGLAEIDLAIRPHEILGVAGVAGNGQRELGDVILGLEPCRRGTKFLGGEDATRWPVAKMRAHGVVFIPEDARRLAAVGGLTVLENLALGDTRRYARAGGFAIDWDAARADLDRALERLGVSIASPDRPIDALSGGNVQRVILARELARDPRLIVAFYPMRGLDVRSAMAARALLLRARDAGAGVLLISEDLDELFALSDRLIVLFRGRIVGSGVPAPPGGRPGELALDEVGYLMTGAERRARG